MKKSSCGHDSKTINILGKKTFFVITMKNRFFVITRKLLTFRTKEACFVIILQKSFFRPYLDNYPHFGQWQFLLNTLKKSVFAITRKLSRKLENMSVKRAFFVIIMKKSFYCHISKTIS